MPKKMGSARLNVGVRFVVLILTVLVAGCAAQTSEQVLKPPDIDLSKRSRAVVVIDHAGSAMPQEADLLATDLSAKLNETGRFSQVDVQTPQPATADYLLVKCSISAIKRVSREERLLIGAIAGRASLDVHVTVVQQPSGKVVGEAQVGGTSSGGNIFAGTTDDAINKTAEAISNFVTSQGLDMTIVPRGLWAFMLFAAFAGCASYDQQPMPTLPATGIQHLKWQGLELSLWQPDAASVKRTFNLDLRAEAILTEFVKAENRSPHDASISPNAMQLSSGTRTYSCLTPDQVAGRLAFSPSERYFVWALGLPLVGIIPGIIDGSNAVDANHLMREDLIEKALKNQIFRSGAKTSGFVFFDVPRTATPDTLTIPVTIEPGQVHGFRFLLPPSADLP